MFGLKSNTAPTTGFLSVCVCTGYILRAHNFVSLCLQQCICLFPISVTKCLKLDVYKEIYLVLELQGRGTV